MSTYAVSDLHGQYETFKEGLKEINFTKNDTLYVTGDAIDRGPDGIRILREIKRRDNMDLIIGNHEFLMLNSIDPDGGPVCTGRDAELWLYGNGGIPTLAKYKKLPVKDRKELIFWLLRRDVIKEVTVRSDSSDKPSRFILTHSYYIDKYLNTPYFEIPYKDVWNIVWRSRFRADTPCDDIYSEFGDATFITGHVPVQRIVGTLLGPMRPPEAYRQGNLYNIDGGLAYGKSPVNPAAIFLRLEDRKQFRIPLKEKATEETPKEK